MFQTNAVNISIADQLPRAQKNAELPSNVSTMINTHYNRIKFLSSITYPDPTNVFTFKVSFEYLKLKKHRFTGCDFISKRDENNQPISSSTRFFNDKFCTPL